MPSRPGFPAAKKRARQAPRQAPARPARCAAHRTGAKARPPPPRWRPPRGRAPPLERGRIKRIARSRQVKAQRGHIACGQMLGNHAPELAHAEIFKPPGADEEDGKVAPRRSRREDPGHAGKGNGLTFMIEGRRASLVTILHGRDANSRHVQASLACGATKPVIALAKPCARAGSFPAIRRITSASSRGTARHSLSAGT